MVARGTLVTGIAQDITSPTPPHEEGKIAWLDHCTRGGGWLTLKGYLLNKLLKERLGIIK